MPVNGAKGFLNCRITDLQTWCYNREPCLPRVMQEKPHSKPTEFSRPVTKERYTGSHILSQEHSAKAYHLGSSQKKVAPTQAWTPEKAQLSQGDPSYCLQGAERSLRSHTACALWRTDESGRNNRKVGCGFVYVCVLLSVQRNRTNTNRARTPSFQITPVDLEKKLKTFLALPRKYEMDSEGHDPVTPAPCYRRCRLCFRTPSGKLLMITPADPW